jgi:hypothetical protein
MHVLATEAKAAVEVAPDFFSSKAVIFLWNLQQLLDYVRLGGLLSIHLWR